MNTLDRLEEISKELLELYNELEEIIVKNRALPTLIPLLQDNYHDTNKLIYIIAEYV